MFAVMEIAVESAASNISLSKGYSLSFPSISTIYLTSIAKVGLWLCIRKNVETFVEVCLLTLCANKTPSIILGQSQGFPSRTFTNMYLVILFSCSQGPFGLGWYAAVMLCLVPIMLCKTLLTLFWLPPLVVYPNLHTSDIWPHKGTEQWWRHFFFNGFCLRTFIVLYCIVMTLF